MVQKNSKSHDSEKRNNMGRDAVNQDGREITEG